MVCRPKEEGGLGIRRIVDMNKALITTHIWSIISKRKSLWVHWTYDYRIKDRSFWDVPCRGVISWGWRKILQQRQDVREFCKTKVGNGKSTSMWYDKWLDVGPLGRFITQRMIANVGYGITDLVETVCADTGWNWPQEWSDVFPVLISVPRPALSEEPDVAVWGASDGTEVGFSVSQFGRW